MRDNEFLNVKNIKGESFKGLERTKDANYEDKKQIKINELKQNK